MKKCILYVIAGLSMIFLPGCFGVYGVVVPHRVVYTSHTPRPKVHVHHHRHYHKRRVIVRVRPRTRHRHVYKRNTYNRTVIHRHYYNNGAKNKRNKRSKKGKKRRR